MSFFTILGAASGDLLSGMMMDRLLEPTKPAEPAKPAIAQTEAAKPATGPSTPQPPKASPQSLKSYRTSMGDRAYY
ncbi:hypothetical protein [Burkholderia ubonensis]|uniref:hypothetical protein n=1 Tax=Burkholderia ubonensis TaxID=101571 RepID=UPI0007550232|nr:hypothetical protein [Burkholderia ubonensis]KVP17293.1 hypothetical protein WJ84_03425 [Burkholderia ubonensis]